MQTDERITTELVREFVMAAHGDLERVQGAFGRITELTSCFL